MYARIYACKIWKVYHISTDIYLLLNVKHSIHSLCCLLEAHVGVCNAFSQSAPVNDGILMYERATLSNQEYFINLFHTYFINVFVCLELYSYYEVK